MYVNITRPVTPPTPKLLLTAKETAASLGVSTKTLYLWDRDGTLPAIHIAARCVRYSPEDLQRFIDSRRKRQTV